MHQKEEALIKKIKELGKVAIAFSGGVDSTYLLDVAKDLQDILIVHVSLHSTPKSETKEARAFCENLAKEKTVEFLQIDFDELSVPGFCENPKNRCYICKLALFSRIKEAAKEHGCNAVLEGSNADDTKDYRPGMQAIKELGINSPLMEVGLTKDEIRKLSKERGLKTWDKPSFACLSSRFVYGETITEEKLRRIEKAEEYLKQQGFVQFRVRMHGNLARIELLPDDIEKMQDQKLRESCNQYFKELGFSYVTLDLQGYRTGSMNIDI